MGLIQRIKERRADKRYDNMILNAWAHKEFVDMEIRHGREKRTNMHGGIDLVVGDIVKNRYFGYLWEVLEVERFTPDLFHVTVTKKIIGGLSRNDELHVGDVSKQVFRDVDLFYVVRNRFGVSATEDREPNRPNYPPFDDEYERKHFKGKVKDRIRPIREYR